jgi:hypothetical protein
MDALIPFLRRWQWTRWLILLAGLTAIVFVSGTLWPEVFRFLGLNESKFIFMDLIAILAAGEANLEGWNVYLFNPLDPLNRPHVYGPWWLVTGQLGLVRSDAWWLGFLISGVFIATAVAVLRPLRGRTMVIALGLMVSPPVFLAMERCNNDLLMFLLLVSAAWLVTSRYRAGMIAGGGMIVLAAALKLYPLVTLPSLAVRAASRRCVIWLVSGTAVVCALVLQDSLEVYRKVSEIAPEPITIFAYGAKLSLFVLQSFPQERTNILIGAVPLFLFSLWVAWRWRREFWRMIPTTGFSAGCFVAGALAWILCYVSTTSFPYRLVLLLLPARLLLNREDADQGDMAGRFLLGATLLYFWSHLSKYELFVLDVVHHRYDGPAFIWMTLGVEYALGLMIAVLLGFALVGWGWRRFYNETHAI